MQVRDPVASHGHIKELVPGHRHGSGRYRLNWSSLLGNFPMTNHLEVADLMAENERLREALKAIDRLASRHVKGAIGMAQRIARIALETKS